MNRWARLYAVGAAEQDQAVLLHHRVIARFVGRDDRRRVEIAAQDRGRCRWYTKHERLLNIEQVKTSQRARLAAAAQGGNRQAGRAGNQPA